MDLLICADCKNYPLLEDYAVFVTDGEKAYRRRTKLGCISGAIVCEGFVDCQLDGRQCQARIEPPIIPDQPDDCHLISPINNIERLDGFIKLLR